MIQLMSKPAVKLAVVVAIQFLVLLAVIAFKQYTIITGETVVLRTAPVDPRDPLRGDYVTVRYEISRLDSRNLAGDENVYGEAYVELREGADGYWEAVAIHNDRKRSFDNSVLIKGDASYSYANRGYDIYNIDYGIEEIFIPEGSGATIPSGRGVTLAVEVKVDRFGNAIARDLVSVNEVDASDNGSQP